MDESPFNLKDYRTAITPRPNFYKFIDGRKNKV